MCTAERFVKGLKDYLGRELKVDEDRGVLPQE